MSSSPPDPQRGILLDGTEDLSTPDGGLFMQIQIVGPLMHVLSFAEIERLTTQFMDTVKRSVTWPPTTT